MDTTDIIYNCAQKLDCDARRFEPMSRHTSFKIGGKADVYIKVTNLSQLMKILKECDVCKEKYILLGNGSNVLVPDEGIHGTVLRLDGDFRNISLIDDTTIYCGAGAALGSLCKFAQKCGLSGLEFAWGIPGTVGGALFMNAGAYGGEMKDVVYSVSHITQNGDIGRTEAENLEFGYRTSVYRKNGCIITGAVFKLKKDDPEEIQNRMNDYMNRRSTKGQNSRLNIRAQAVCSKDPRVHLQVRSLSNADSRAKLSGALRSAKSTQDLSSTNQRLRLTM